MSLFEEYIRVLPETINQNSMRIISIMALIILANCIGCKKKTSVTPATTIISPGNDPNFKIEANNDGILTHLPKKVMVFGVPIYAASGVDDAKLLHAANIMAQYLDNNEDGQVDNTTVVETMKSNKAFLFMWKTEADQKEPPAGYTGQDLGNDETIPEWHTNGHTGRYDAALEEVLHIITHAGYAKAYPQVFGEQIGTSIANAMDKARGGQFTTIPSNYPTGAWYTYNDNTCNYACMVTEYHYWAFTSVLGAQANRLSEIEQEWKLNTKAKVETQDATVYQLLTNAQYAFPTKLPDGTYKR